MLTKEKLIEWLNEKSKEEEIQVEKHKEGEMHQYHLGRSLAFGEVIIEIIRMDNRTSPELEQFRKLLDEYANLDEEEREAYWNK